MDRLALIRFPALKRAGMATERTLVLCTYQKMFERAERSVTLVIECEFQTGLTKSAFSVANRRLEKLRSFSKLTILDLTSGHDVLHSDRFVDVSVKIKPVTCFPGKEILCVLPHYTLLSR